MHQKVYHEVLELLVSRTEKLIIGNPEDPLTAMGPVCGRDQEKKILSYIEIGKNEGAKLLIGGRKLTHPPFDRGFFPSPFCRVCYSSTCDREKPGAHPPSDTGEKDRCGHNEYFSAFLSQKDSSEGDLPRKGSTSQ